MKPTIPLLLGIVLLPLTGCGDGGPKLVSVTGTILLNGKPYSGALVEFMPEQSNRESTIGSDVTGPDGTYRVRSSTGRFGLAPGKYMVNVSKAPPVAAVVGGDSAPTPENDPGQQVAEATVAGPKRKAVDPSESATAKFPAEVPAGGGVVDYDVKSGAK